MLATIGAVLALVCLTGAQPSERGRSDPRVFDLRERLEALDGADASAYFELGEEVLAQRMGESDRRLAAELLCLAMTIGLGEGDTGLAGGACLALGELVDAEEERRWLVAVARGIDERYAPASWREARPPVVDGIARAAAEAFTLVRAGEGYEARRRLDQPGVSERIERVCGEGWVERLRREADAWPCEECRNQRFVRERDGRETVCPVCRGNPGPALDRAALLDSLAMEARLLGVQERSWAAMLAVGGGAPALDPNPADVPAHFGVDPEARLWRDGAWVKP